MEEGVGVAWGTIQQRSSSNLFYKRPLGQDLAWAGMSILWCCPSSIFSADHGVAHPPACPEGPVLLWRVTCPNHTSFRLLTDARRGSCGPTRKLFLIRTKSLVLCSKMRRSFLMHLVSKVWILSFSESASRVHVSQSSQNVSTKSDRYVIYLDLFLLSLSCTMIIVCRKALVRSHEQG